MRYLLVTPQFGYDSQGASTPGGLLQFGRCVARALASSPDLQSLDVWCQVDCPSAESQIRGAIQTHAHASLDLRVRAFGSRRLVLAAAMAEACWRGRFDRVMYTLLNQAALSEIAFHPRFDVWQVGTEFFRRLSAARIRIVRRADRVFSISSHTTRLAAKYTPGLRKGIVVHLCTEPWSDQSTSFACEREAAVLIVGNMHGDLMYKGHQQLIAAWPRVTSVCMDAQLWIVGAGDGVPLLREQVNMLAAHVARRIRFFGAVDAGQLERCYQSARVFGLPSSGEGFGLVFVEAARHGLPCIGGKHDSAREIIFNNQTGLLIEQHPHDIANACIRLLRDDALAGRLGAAARQRYWNYFRFPQFRERLLSIMGLGC